MISPLLRRPVQLTILFVPVGALLVGAAFRISSNLAELDRAEATRELVGLAAQTTAVVHELQEERDRASNFVAGGRQGGTGRMQAQAERTDKAIARFFRVELDGTRTASFGEQFDILLSDAHRGLSGLDGHRQTVSEQTRTYEDTTGAFTQVIDVLLAVADRSSEEAGDAGLGSVLETTAALSRVKEYASQQRAYLAWSLRKGGLDGGGRAQLAEVVGAEETWVNRLRGAAGGQPVVTAMVAAEANRQVNTLRGRALESNDDDDLGVNPDDWWPAATAKADQLRQSERDLVAQAVTRGTEVNSRAQVRAMTEAALIVAILVVTVVATFLIARALKLSRRTAAQRQMGPQAAGGPPGWTGEQPAVGPPRKRGLFGFGRKKNQDDLWPELTSEWGAQGESGQWPRQGDSGQWAARGESGQWTQGSGQWQQPGESGQWRAPHPGESGQWGPPSGQWGPVGRGTTGQWPRQGDSGQWPQGDSGQWSPPGPGDSGQWAPVRPDSSGRADSGQWGRPGGGGDSGQWPRQGDSGQWAAPRPGTPPPTSAKETWAGIPLGNATGAWNGGTAAWSTRTGQTNPGQGPGSDQVDGLTIFGQQPPGHGQAPPPRQQPDAGRDRLQQPGGQPPFQQQPPGQPPVGQGGFGQARHLQDQPPPTGSRPPFGQPQPQQPAPPPFGQQPGRAPSQPPLQQPPQHAAGRPTDRPPDRPADATPSPTTMSGAARGLSGGRSGRISTGLTGEFGHGATGQTRPSDAIGPDPTGRTGRTRPSDAVGPDPTGRTRPSDAIGPDPTGRSGRTRPTDAVGPDPTGRTGRAGRAGGPSGSGATGRAPGVTDDFPPEALARTGITYPPVGGLGASGLPNRIPGSRSTGGFPTQHPPAQPPTARPSDLPRRGSGPSTGGFDTVGTGRSGPSTGGFGSTSGRGPSTGGFDALGTGRSGPSTGGFGSVSGPSTGGFGGRTGSGGPSTGGFDALGTGRSGPSTGGFGSVSGPSTGGFGAGGLGSPSSSSSSAFGSVPTPPPTPPVPTPPTGLTDPGLPRRHVDPNEHLPIYEQAKWDWFDTNRRRRAAEEGMTAARPPGRPVDGPTTGPGLGSWAGAPGTPGSAQGDAGLTMGGVSGWYIPEDSPQKPKLERTGAGLPRRVPRSHLAPALAFAGAAERRGGPGANGAAHDTPTGPPPEARKPDDVRDTLHAYQSGFERGRQEAAKWFKALLEQPPDGPTRPPGTTR